MRSFTRIFKSILELGAEPKAYVLGMWATVKAAADGNPSKPPGLALATAFIDKLIGVVADLPKPDDKDEPEVKPGAGPATPAREPDLLEGNRG